MDYKQMKKKNISCPGRQQRQRRTIKQGDRTSQGRVGVARLRMVIREVLTERVIFRQRLEGEGGAMCLHVDRGLARRGLS